MSKEHATEPDLLFLFCHHDLRRHSQLFQLIPTTLNTISHSFAINHNNPLQTNLNLPTLASVITHSTSRSSMNSDESTTTDETQHTTTAIDAANYILDVPIPSSSDASLATTVSSILLDEDEKSSSRSRATSPSPGAIRRSASVTFAPLPYIEPRTKKYSLGIAARTQALRIRRAQQMEMQKEQQAAWIEVPRQGRKCYTPAQVVGDDAEEAMQIFGAFVRGMIRKMTKPTRQGKGLTDAEDESAPVQKIVRIFREGVEGTDDGSNGAGGVWEEEVAEELRIQQASKVDSLTRRSSSTQRNSVVSIDAGVNAT